jgi:hypothetical protein
MLAADVVIYLLKQVCPVVDQEDMLEMGRFRIGRCIPASGPLLMLLVLIEGLLC